MEYGAPSTPRHFTRARDSFTVGYLPREIRGTIEEGFGVSSWCALFQGRLKISSERFAKVLKLHFDPLILEDLSIFKTFVIYNRKTCQVCDLGMT